MKTFFIDLDSMSLDDSRDLLGFVLTVGLKFRKIELVKNEASSRALAVETETLAESKALSDFFEKRLLEKPITILSNNKATIGLKTIGKLKLLGENANAPAYYLDKITGKRLVIV
jgi:hypothetical protein